MLHHRCILLIIVQGFWISTFAIDWFTSYSMPRLFKYFFRALFIFKKYKTKWSTFLLCFIDGCFYLCNLKFEKKTKRFNNSFNRNRKKNKPFRIERNILVTEHLLFRYQDRQQRLYGLMLDHDDAQTSYRHVYLEWRESLENKPILIKHQIAKFSYS